MQLIAALIFVGLMLLVLAAALYFASHQKTRNQGYGSWSRVLGSQFNGRAMDIQENLNTEISKAQHQSRRAQRSHHTRNKHK